ncbi:hypothetical protein [Mucisphaera sp.]|uniref:hypothetical protein n=1 Tax=Mucisphaera sp. TaxID=2913024 RepID=UPI003D10BF50
MLKVFLGVFLSIIAGMYAVYYLAGLNVDPNEQGQAFRDAVQVGMDWADVVDLREPKKCVRMNYDTPGLMPARLETRYDADHVKGLVSSGKAMDGGFFFPYVFSGDMAFSVHFDGNGKVVAVEDDKTTADLFSGNLFSP